MGQKAAGTLPMFKPGQGSEGGSLACAATLSNYPNAVSAREKAPPIASPAARILGRSLQSLRSRKLGFRVIAHLVTFSCATTELDLRSCSRSAGSLKRSSKKEAPRRALGLETGGRPVGLGSGRHPLMPELGQGFRVDGTLCRTGVSCHEPLRSGPKLRLRRLGRREKPKEDVSRRPHQKLCAWLDHRAASNEGRTRRSCSPSIMRMGARPTCASLQKQPGTATWSSWTSRASGRRAAISRAARSSG
jgi:hypothetical protein